MSGIVLSLRERKVLTVVVHRQAISLSVLEHHFEGQIPQDEIRAIVSVLETKGAVGVVQESRSKTVAMTAAGRAAIEEVSGRA